MGIPEFSSAEYQRRLAEIQRGLASAGIGALLITDESNYRYLTGHFTDAWKIPYVRRVCWVRPEGEPTLVVSPGEREDVEQLSPWTDIREHGGYSWGPMEVAGVPVVDYAANFARAIAEVGSDIGVSAAGSIATCLGGWTSPNLPVGVIGEVASLLGSEWADGTPVLWQARLVKSADEIAYMRASVRTLDVAFAETLKHLHEGTSERQIADLMKSNIFAAGAEEDAFTFVDSDIRRPRVIGSSPGTDTLEGGTVFFLDAGAVVHGYRSDYSRLAAIGTPSEEAAAAYHGMYEAQQAGMRAAVPGATAGDVATAIENVLAANGFNLSAPTDSPSSPQGHGIGIELPEVPFLVANSEFVLEEGMILTIEPNATHPAGRFVLEDDVVVTADGAEHLSEVPTSEQLIQL